MSRKPTSLSMITRVTFLVLLGLITLTDPELVLIFFVPFAGWLIWRDQDRIAQLERRLVALEKPPPLKSEEP